MLSFDLELHGDHCGDTALNELCGGTLERDEGTRFHLAPATGIEDDEGSEFGWLGAEIPQIIGIKPGPPAIRFPLYDNEACLSASLPAMTDKWEICPSAASHSLAGSAIGP
jgi:hypothetical protein